MALKTYRPTTPSLRQLVQVDRDHCGRARPIKVLTEGKTKSGGRNNYGRITTRHIGGGHKQAYRRVDFKRNKHDMPANVERLEYDPNRTAFLALLKYSDGTLAYILAPQRLGVGDTVVSGIKADVKPGNAMQLASMPIGTIVPQHRAEGRRRRQDRALGRRLRPAGRPRRGLGRSCASTRARRGACAPSAWPPSAPVSNPDHMNESTGKAGRTRWRGTRPTVRSIAMNPIDHPNGGRTKGGKHWATPWGKSTKGFKTRKNKATDRFIIRSRLKSK
jgi:large subunit ribosomal protein L2